MELVASREQLLATLTKAHGVINQHPTVPVLSNVKLEAKDGTLTATGTDLDVTVKGNCVANIEVDGSITCSSKRLYALVRALPLGAVVYIDEKDGHLLIRSGRSRYKLKTLPSSDFPDVDAMDLEFTGNFTIQEQELLECISNASYSMARNDVRYYLNGLNVDITSSTVKFASTDGHRLAVTDVEVEHISGDANLIIPNKVVGIIAKLLDKDAGDSLLTINYTQDHFQVSKGDWEITSKLIAGKYPDYSAAVPKGYLASVVVNKKEFIDAVRRSMILANDKFKGGTIQLSGSELRIISINPENEKSVEIIDADYSGEDFEVGFNLKYVIDAANNCKGDIVNMFLNGEQAASKLTGCGGSLNIIMPVRL